MPANKDVKKVIPASGIRFDIEPKTEFRNNLQSIKIKLLGAMPIELLQQYIGNWVHATWNKKPLDSSKDRHIEEYIKGAAKGEVLPSVLETIPLTFLVEGISLIEVTHLLRHRQFSFSADCSGDKMWNEKDALVPNSIENSDEFVDKYIKLVDESKKLYCDMINSKKISIMDARYILPRCLSTYYFVHCDLRSCLDFIKQRIDKQIQPETDNIIAYKMYLEIVKQYPFLKGIINLHAPAMNYVKQANTNNASNLYLPDEDSDIFEYNPESFVYNCTRDKLNGTNEYAPNRFNHELKKIEKELNNI
jgi:thymidylate synthase ThyX